MQLHYRSIHMFVPTEDHVNVSLGCSGNMHRVSSHCVSSPPDRVVPPQWFDQTPQIQIWIWSVRIRQVICLGQALMKHLMYVDEGCKGIWA